MIRRLLPGCCTLTDFIGIYVMTSAQVWGRTPYAGSVPSKSATASLVLNLGAVIMRL